MRGQSAGGYRDSFLGREAARDGEHRNNNEKPADQHGEAEGHVVPRRVRAKASKRTAVIGRGARERVEDLSESVRPAVGDRAESRAISRDTTEQKDHAGGGD